jgi:hypothetical protein
MTSINRSQGWTNAKNSGHLNEDIITEHINQKNDGNVAKNIGSIRLESTSGKKIPVKPDLIMTLNNKKIKVSVKKSLSGQVHLTKVNIFVDGYEKSYQTIPTNVKNALSLTFGGNKDVNIILNDEVYDHNDDKVMVTQRRRKTICFDTLKKYNNQMYEDMIQWIKDNITNITEIVFKTGFVIDENYYADNIWYKNMVDENQPVDQLFDINELISKCDQFKNEIYGKTKNGGTVINLPFGHLQYHQGGLQFHHNYEKIKSMFHS